MIDPGSQFVHIDLHGMRRCGQRQTVHAVLGEAVRQPEACIHISNLQPPVYIFGMKIEELKTLHDQKHASARVQLNNGKTRRIRDDQLTLMSCVASCRTSYDKMISDPQIRKMVKDWSGKVVDWLTAKYGSQLKTVILHTDEAYIHLHAYILPSAPDMRAKKLHCGEVAKLVSQAAARAAGEDKKLANSRGDKAYKNAMREFQNEYFDKVGSTVGQARLGPKRRRMTRAEWLEEQQHRELNQTNIEKHADRENELLYRIEELEKYIELLEADEKLREWQDVARPIHRPG